MVTLEDVARHAGVSLATASRVLNGSTRQVGASLRARVEQAAQQLGYRTNVAAQTLARGASNVIGLVVHDLTDPYFAALADGAMRVAEDQGLMVMVATTHRDPEREIAYVATLNAQRVRAVLLAGSRIADPGVTRRLREELDRYRATGGRIACVARTCSAPTRWRPATPRAPPSSPAPSPVWGTGASPCWPGRPG